MKLTKTYIIGLLASFFILTGIAGATYDVTLPFIYDNAQNTGNFLANHPLSGGVTVNQYGPGTFTIRFENLNPTTAAGGSFFKLGFLPDNLNIIHIYDSISPNVDVYQNSNDQLNEWSEADADNNFGGGLGTVLETDATGNHKPTWVEVVFSGSVPSDLKLGAHYRWTDGAVNGKTSGVFGTWDPRNPPEPPTQVPEFPSLALPIAAVLGLLFISQRTRKEE